MVIVHGALWYMVQIDDHGTWCIVVHGQVDDHGTWCIVVHGTNR